MSVCEYCGDAKSTLYAWRGDVWCADCLTALHQTLPYLPALGQLLAQAPRGRPAEASADQPYVRRTPDGRVDMGQVQPPTVNGGEVSFKASNADAQGRVMAAVAGAGYTVSSGGDWSANPTTVSVRSVREADREKLAALVLAADPGARPV